LDGEKEKKESRERGSEKSLSLSLLSFGGDEK
jgi:hypothetical protein